MAENKISSEHLEEVQENVNKINNVALQIGQLELQKFVLLLGGNDLQKDFGKVQKKLEEKYGKINIDLKDGSFEKIEEEKE
jgi:hypothetical protein